MYRRAATVYDLVYAWKDYRKEAALIDRLIARHKLSSGRTLLDVACGTGMHLAHLKSRYDVEGVDINPIMLAAARKRNPGVRLHRGDMRTFDLGRKFHVVTCLFGSICAMRELSDMRRAVANMARHLRPGGVLVLEPFLTPQSIEPGHISAVFEAGRGAKVARMGVGRKAGRLLIIPTHYLHGTPSGVRHWVETMRLGLYTVAEMVDALRRAGLQPKRYARGPMGRGLYACVKPLGTTRGARSTE